MLTSLCARLFLACWRSVRLSSALRTAASTSTAWARNGAVSAGSMLDGPEVGRRRIVNQRAQPIFRALDRRLRHDDRLVVPRDLRLRFDDVDRRHGADLHAPFVVPEQALRQLQRLTLCRQVVDLERQVPVRVLHVARRLDDRRRSCTSALSRDFLLISSCCRMLSILKSRSSGWRDVQEHVRAQQRIEVAEDVRRARARAVPAERIAGAGRQHLVEANRRRERRVGDLRQAAGQRVGRRVVGRVVVEAGGEFRRPEAPRLGDGDVLDLRVHPLDLDAEVLFERQLHRIVDRQPAHRSRPPRRRLRGLVRREVCANARRDDAGVSTAQRRKQRRLRDMRHHSVKENRPVPMNRRSPGRVRFGRDAKCILREHES